MTGHWEFWVAIVGAVTVFWNQAKAFTAWLKSWVIVTKKHDFYTGRLMLSFFDSTMRRTSKANGSYGSVTTFVRPLERMYRVIYQSLFGSNQTFWQKGRPIWFGAQSVDRNEANAAHSDYMFSFSFLRGSYDWEKLLLQAADWEDGTKQGSTKTTSRYRVQYHYGTGFFDKMDGNAERGPLSRAIEGSPEAYMWNGPACGTRLLRWSFEDVQNTSTLSSIDNLSLCDELKDVVAELTFWHESQAWYQKHGLPWRRGMAFHGGPGTGKTSLARAVAETLDLPVHVFDLAGMSNQDLKRSWRDMLGSAPCIALLEDVDAVFVGRTNVVATNGMGPGGLTFDTLLNCLDGIERVDGVLVILTTNRLDTLDPALVDRPGRINRVVEFKPLNHEGRVKLATRILDSVEMAIEMAMRHQDDSAARFQERCFQVALQQRFRDSA